VPKESNGRLFVPLSTQPYIWFEMGLKKWELRKYGRQYTEKHVYPGRRVELRRGYSDKTRALWGVVEMVEYADDLQSFFNKVAFNEVIPFASSIEEAISQVELILSIQPEERRRMIGFKIRIPIMATSVHL
jgi:hypothetical protein